MRRKRVVARRPRARSSSKRSSAAGSRSMQIERAGRRRCGRRPGARGRPRRTCSRRRSRPGCGSSRSISSPARTGTCVRVMSRRMAKALRYLADLAIQRLADPSASGRGPRSPGGRRCRPRPRPSRSPRARAAAGRGSRGRPSRARRPTSSRRSSARACGARVLTGLRLEQGALGPRSNEVGRPDRDAGLERLGENHSVGEGGAELGRHVEPVLRVERVVEVPAEGQLMSPDCMSSEGSACGPGWRSGRSPATPARSRCATPYPTRSHCATHLPTFSIRVGARRTPARRPR